MKVNRLPQAVYAFMVAIILLAAGGTAYAANSTKNIGGNVISRTDPLAVRDCDSTATTNCATYSANGSKQVAGAAASGAASVDNPVLVGGSTGSLTESLNVDTGGRLGVSPAEQATPVTGTASGAAASEVATLTGAAAKFSYICGFAVTGLGATSAGSVQVAVAGVVTGTMNFTQAVPAGATVGITPTIVNFSHCIQSSAVNTNITVTAPSFGTGNTVATVSAWGYLY